MNAIQKYFTLRPIIWCFFVLSVVVVITIHFELFEITEPFKGGYKFEPIFERLAYAFITSFIFYYLVIFLPTVQEKESFKKFLDKELSDFYIAYVDIVNAIYTLGGDAIKNVNAAPDSEAIKPIFEKIHSGSPGNWGSITQRLTIWQQMWRMMELYRLTHEKILLRSNLYIPELSDKLMNIERSGLFDQLRQLGPSIPNLPLNHHFDFFWEFDELVNDLSDFSEKKYNTDSVNRFYTE